MSAQANKSPDWHPELDIDKIHMLDECRSGRIDEVCKLLDGCSNGSPAVDVDEGDDDGTTALQIAAAKGNLNLVDTLYCNYNAKVNLANELGFTPFLHACREGHLAVATRLKEYGADETLKTKFGVSALGLAAAGGHLEIINFLLSLNLDINSKETNLTPTPLMAAAARSQVQAATCLESRGAKINYMSPVLGLSAMHMALISGSEDILAALIDLGARLEDTSLCNKDAKMIAEHANNLDAIRFIGRKQQNAQRMLYPKMQIVDIIDNSDMSELQQLRYRDAREREINGSTPIMIAVLLGRPQAVQFFCNPENHLNRLNFETELNAQEPELGLTSLMMAVIVGDLNIVEQLLNAGANPHLEAKAKKDGEPFTAFDLALFSGFNEALKLLFVYEYAGETSFKQFSSSKDSKSMPKELLNKFLHRFGLSNDEVDDSTLQCQQHTTRAAFDSLVNSSFIGWDDSLPFVTAEQLLATGLRPPPTQHQSTVDDRLKLVRNMAKVIIEKEGFLKPFPVGIPRNGNYTPVENYLLSPNNPKRPSKLDVYRNYQPSTQQKYREMQEAVSNKSSARSQSNSNVRRREASMSDYYADSLGRLAVPTVGGIDYDQLKLFHLIGGRSVPSRRQSENNTYNRSNPHAVNDSKFWSSSDATNYNYSDSSTMALNQPDKSCYHRTQSPLLSNRSNNFVFPNRPFSVYSMQTNTNALSMPNSPAIQPTSQRRYPVRAHTPTHSPKSSFSNQVIRKRVPPVLTAPKFDFPYTVSSSAPPTPPISTVNTVQLPKSLPGTQRLPVLTMIEIENCLKSINLDTYFVKFVEHEVDPSVFLQLNHSDIQIIVQNEDVAKRIGALVQKLRMEYPSAGLTEAL